jgi:hypothetical protein
MAVKKFTSSSIKLDNRYQSLLANNERREAYFIATLGNSGSTDVGYGIGFDSSRNVYISYRTNDSTSPYYRCAIAKYNKFGTLQWQRRQSFNNPGYQDNDVIADASGNTFVLSNTITSDGENNVGGGVITKYNTTGDLIWQSGFAWYYDSYCDSVTIDTSGNVFINGLFNSGSGYSNTVAKYNSSGTFQWSRYLTPIRGEGHGVATDSSGNIYGGGFGGTGIYGITTTKFNTSGTMQFIKNFQGPGSAYDSYGGRLAVDSSTNIYQIGTLRAAPTVYQAFLIKRDSAGTLQWQRKISNSSSSYGIVPVDVTTDSSGNIYTTNYTLISSVQNTIVAKWNSSGTLQWQRSILASGGFGVGKIKVDSLGNMYIIGTTNSSSTGDVVVFKLPSDGSLTGTYSVGGYSITYAASSLTEAAGDGVESSSANTATSGLGAEVASYTLNTTTFTNSAVTFV